MKEGTGARRGKEWGLTARGAVQDVLQVSKKDVCQKRKELLKAGDPTFAQAVTGCCVTLLPELLRGPPATDILIEIARGGEAGAPVFL